MSKHARNTAVFSILTMVSKVSGLLRFMVFAYAVGGRTVLADSFQLAFLIPNTIYEFIAGGLLSAIFIPLLVREQEQSTPPAKPTWNVANLLLGAVGVILLVTSVLGILASPWIIDAMTMMGSKASLAEKQEIATLLFRYFAPQIFLLGINAIFMAVLNSVGVFAITAAAPIINNIFMIASFLAFHYGWLDIPGLAIGTTLGAAAMVLVQLPYVIKAGMPIRPRFNLKHPVFRAVTQLGWPIVLVSIVNLGGWVFRTNLLNTVLGAFAIYTYCFNIIMMPYGIFAVSIATVLYPTLSRHAANKRKIEFVADMSLGFRWTLFLLLPIAFGTMVLSMPIIRVLFEHRGGQFTYPDSLFAGKFLFYYAPSIATYAMVMFATRVFYSMEDTRTPAMINIGGVFLNAAISYVLLKYMGASGIALGASLTYGLTTAISMVMIRQITGGLGGKTLWVSIAKMLTASTLMALVVHSAANWSRPDIVLVEKGSRLPMPVPASTKSGGYTLLKSDQDLARVWNAMERSPETVPLIDFQRSQVALLWGPATSTTTTLSLAPPGSATLATTATLNVGVYSSAKATSATHTADAPTSPAYALIQLRNTAENVTWSQTIMPPGTTPAKPYLIDPELLRLIFLVTLGGVIYLISAIVFKMSELDSFTSQIKRRFAKKSEEQ